MPLVPVPLDDATLHELCYSLSNTSYIYYPQATQYFQDLYHTGCRPSELLTQSLWTYIDDDFCTLQPLKGNSLRAFSPQDLSTSLVQAMQNDIEPYDGLSYRQLKSVLYKIIPVPEVFTTEKSSIEYIFRYNKVRRLFAEGFDDAEIAVMFGWSSSTMSTLYRARTLFTLGPVPNLGANTIINNDANWLIDSDGTIVSFP